MTCQLSYALSSAKKNWKLAFLRANEIWSNSGFFDFWEVLKSKIQKNSNFQALLEKKLKVVWKNFPAPKMCQIVQKIHFFGLEVVKTTFRWIFWQKSKIQKTHLKNFKFRFFSRAYLQALEKNFFKNFENSISQLSYALSSTKKYLKLAFLSQKEVHVIMAQICKFWGKKNHLL